MRAYVMRVNEPDREPINVGDLAVLSGDSKSAVYCDSEQLWLTDLDGEPGNRTKLRGTGRPVDVSVDGRFVLTVRTTPATESRIDQEIWIVDTATNVEKKIAIGYGPVFLGETSTHGTFLGWVRGETVYCRP